MTKPTNAFKAIGRPGLRKWIYGSLTVLASIVALTQVEPLLDRWARHSREQFCRQLLAGKSANAMLKLPESSRGVILRNLRGRPLKCQDEEITEYLVLPDRLGISHHVGIELADHAYFSIFFRYSSLPNTEWKHWRLDGVDVVGFDDLQKRVKEI